MQRLLPIFLKKHPRLVIFFREIFISPQKTTFFLLTIAFVVSAFLFAGLLISQNLDAEKALVARKQELENRAHNALKKEKNNAVAANNSLDQNRKRDLAQIQSALSKFKSKTGFYPANLLNLVPNYLARVPQDPKTNKEYFYQVGIDQKSYQLRVLLSDGEEYSLEAN